MIMWTLGGMLGKKENGDNMNYIRYADDIVGLLIAVNEKKACY